MLLPRQVIQFKYGRLHLKAVFSAHICRLMVALAPSVMAAAAAAATQDPLKAQRSSRRRRTHLKMRWQQKRSCSSFFMTSYVSVSF